MRKLSHLLKLVRSTASKIISITVARSRSSFHWDEQFVLGEAAFNINKPSLSLEEVI